MISADLAAQIVYRNARFRAWKALGAPVRGLWWEDGVEVRLEVGCTQCGEWCPSDKWWWLYGMDGEALEHEEEDTIKAIDCPHLAPLLGPEPEGFSDVLALELLAGEVPK